MKLKVLVTVPEGYTRDSFFPDCVVKKLESIADVDWNETNAQLRDEQFQKRIMDVDVCMTGWGSSRYDKDALETAKRLRIVAHTGGSVAGIVSDYLYDKGITVLSGNMLYAESVAEGTITYILCALRKIPYFSNEMQKGVWSKNGSFINEGLLNQKVGLVGFGAVAKFLVKMLAPFNTEIKVFDPYLSDEILLSYGVQRASLEEIFRSSKIISIHAAKTPDTYHMIGKDLLQVIPDDALLVNTARASIIDTSALEEELAKNRFKAVLDVFDVEPLPANSKLFHLPNVILMPHMAGPTIDRRKIVTLALIDDIQRIYEGKQPKLSIDRKYAMAMTQ